MIHRDTRFIAIVALGFYVKHPVIRNVLTMRALINGRARILAISDSELFRFKMHFRQ